MNVHEPNHKSQLRAEAERFRASGTLGRSDLMGRLFDYLLSRSLSGDVPKEFEVAHDVFGKDAGFDAVQDASVRVTVYRLRRKLDEHYAAAPADGTRLFIPRGEYRLALAPAREVPPTSPDEESEETAAPAIRSPRAARFWAVLAALLLMVSAAGWWWVLDSREADPAAAAAASPPWAVFDPARPMVLVVGDYYIFGETDPVTGMSRLVREFSVNSREDLDELLMQRPELIGRYVDVDLHYLPTSAASALNSVVPLVQRAGRSAAGPLRVITASALTPATVKGANLVYVGYLSGMGLLRAPVFAGSHFTVGTTYDELVDRRSGRSYVSDWMRVMDGRTPNRDYAYISSLPGPSGSRILIVAGMRDGALTQAADIAADTEELERIAASVKGARAFEALYEVQTLGTTDIGRRLVAAYPIDARNIWRQLDGSGQSFPDQLPPPEE